MNSSFDEIAEKFSTVKPGRTVEFVYDPSEFALIGNVKGLDILEVGCGSGRESRKLASLGARSVTAIDLSSKNIELAENEENKHPLGIRYHKMNILDMKFKEMFDLCVSNFVLSYARDTQELEVFCMKMFQCLKAGGRAVGFLPIEYPNIDYPENQAKRYGFWREIIGEAYDGKDMNTNLYDSSGNKVTVTPSKFYRKVTYQRCFEKAGFFFKWHVPIVSQEGIAAYGEEFWHGLLNPPKALIFEAKKFGISES